MGFPPQEDTHLTRNLYVKDGTLHLPVPELLSYFLGKASPLTKSPFLGRSPLQM